jgi:hypothetical protein
MDLDHYRVSPKFGRKKLENPTIEDKIDVYEDRLQGWIFDHVNWLLSDAYPYHEQAVIAVLILTVAYFEQHWSYRMGQDSDGREFDFFSAGFDNVFKVPAKDARSIKGIFWGEIRSKLAHEWLPGGRVIIDPHQAGSIGYAVNEASHIGSIAINSKLFVQGLYSHFRAYIQMLRDPDQHESRANFERFFDFLQSRKGPVPTDRLPLVDRSGLHDENR